MITFSTVVVVIPAIAVFVAISLLSVSITVNVIVSVIGSKLPWLVKSLKVTVTSAPSDVSASRLNTTQDVVYDTTLAPVKVTPLTSTAVGNSAVNRSVVRNNASSMGVIHKM